MGFQGFAWLWQDSERFMSRLWAYLTQPFTFGRITVSISSVIMGVVAFIITVAVARYLSTFVDGRM